MMFWRYFLFLGTDTTGCVRIPASFCGVIGFRPSHGAISTIGVLPNSQSLDTVGMSQKESFSRSSVFKSLFIGYRFFFSLTFFIVF